MSEVKELICIAGWPWPLGLDRLDGDERVELLNQVFEVQNHGTAKQGQRLLLEAWGSLSATNAVKTIRMYFGSSIVYIAAQVTPAAVTAGDWSAQLLVTKTANNVQIALGTSDFSGAAVVRNQLPKINEAAN